MMPAAPWVSGGQLFAGQCDISTVGVNGRDQTEPFSPGNTVHFFGIVGPAGDGLLASLLSASPNLPSGYTTAFPVSAMVLDSSGALLKSVQSTALSAAGSDIFLTDASQTSVLSAGPSIGAAAAAPVDLSHIVPAAAVDITLRLIGTNGTHVLGPISGQNMVSFADGVTLNVPNVGQSIFYNNVDSGGLLSVNVLGYRIT
jgi:hypothetical protein